jgi:hypothetical protein
VFKLYLALIVLAKNGCSWIFGLILGEVGPIYNVDLPTLGLWCFLLGRGHTKGKDQNEKRNPFQIRRILSKSMTFRASCTWTLESFGI